MTACVEPESFRAWWRRWCRLSVQALLNVSTCELPLLRKRPEHALYQRRVAIFLDLPDLAVPGSIWLRHLMLQTGRDLERDRRRAA
jgi:hypothetical protein